jgi:hypothetical protein
MPFLLPAAQPQRYGQPKYDAPMKTKLKRFAILSIIMISSLFLAYMLLAIHNGEGRERWRDYLIMAIAVGILAPASMIFCRKSKKKQE